MNRKYGRPATGIMLRYIGVAKIADFAYVLTVSGDNNQHKWTNRRQLSLNL
jgi:hypothetical protein